MIQKPNIISCIVYFDKFIFILYMYNHFIYIMIEKEITYMYKTL